MSEVLDRLGRLSKTAVKAPILPFAAAALRDSRPGPTTDDYSVEQRLEAAIQWLMRAQDESPDDGVSHSYSLKGGWRASYVETTGYILCTFYDLAEQGRGDHFRERAERQARWLLGAQLPDGSFPNVDLDPTRGLIFDTGQDLFGMVRAYRETNDERFVDATVRAGQWLVDISDERGLWSRSTYKNVPHVYNTRSAWALLQAHGVRPHADFERVARANLDWALEQQTPVGWYDNCAFERDVPPFTHTIAYAARGLLESGILLGDERYKESARKVADALIPLLDTDGFLPGQVGLDGSPVRYYSCLTGNVQMAIVWEKLYQLTEQRRYREAAVRTTRYVMSKQPMDVKDPNVRGAIAGSFPIWGRYHRFQYPNWPTKFFIDAVLILGDAL